MRAFVMGPPASGKTTMVKQLCEHYKLHHIKIKDVIDEAMERLVSVIKNREAVLEIFPISYSEHPAEDKPLR